jgi:hypothetical protein
LTRPLFVIFVVFKANMSSSLGVAAPLVAATVVLAAVCVEGGLSLTIEAQDFIECNKYKKWNAINYCF